jgi:hypothetical protein
VVFDIGANIGLHTALLSRLVGADPAAGLHKVRCRRRRAEGLSGGFENPRLR